MARLKWVWTLYVIATVFLYPATNSFCSEEIVKIALNYPQTGPYAKEGKDQWYAAEIARKEINDAGGILGNKVIYRWYDSASNPNKTKANISQAVDRENVKMVFGGSSSAVAIAAGKVCKEKNVVFFGTLTYSNATTGTEANRWSFRECYNAWMGAKAIASFMKQNFKDARYFYITADYTWGWSTEASLRRFTGTEDKSQHPGILTPFPSGYYDDALKKAEEYKPDVLVLVLFGGEMATAIRKAEEMGLKGKMQIVVPNLALTMAERGDAQGHGRRHRGCSLVLQSYLTSITTPGESNLSTNLKKRFNRYPAPPQHPHTPSCTSTKMRWSGPAPLIRLP